MSSDYDGHGLPPAPPRRLVEAPVAFYADRDAAEPIPPDPDGVVRIDAQSALERRDQAAAGDD